MFGDTPIWVWECGGFHPKKRVGTREVYRVFVSPPGLCGVPPVGGESLLGKHTTPHLNGGAPI